jgi:hypothetical protein
LKIYLKIFFIALLSLLILISCDEEAPNEPPTQEYPDYYPDNVGSTYKYSITETDSVGNFVLTGSRNILYSGNTNFRGREYVTQEDSLDFGSQSSINTFLFRKSDTGIFYAVDTSQIALLIPDSLRQYVTLRDEMQLLFYPLTSGSTWSLYRVTADVQPGISVRILDIIATFEATEQLDLNLNSGTISVNAQKIKYELEFVEDVTSDPLTYTAWMWFVEDIGLVKFEGNQVILDFTGGAINIEITNNILVQEIIEFNINLI